MSKIGNKLINISDAVKVELGKNNISISGVNGQVNLNFPDGIIIKHDKTQISVSVETNSNLKAYHGLWRSLIANAVMGVQTPWTKTLEIHGTGYRVKLEGENLLFELGFSHPVIFNKVPGLTFSVKGSNIIIISGANKELVGQIAYKIKSLKKPDKYKGKGIRYQGEIIKLKPGKKVVTGA